MTMARRPLGRTGVELSVVGFGGILTMDESPAESARVVAAAVERGVNYFDVAPTYGNAEERLGPALEPHRRGVFLACKTTDRTKEGAARELRASLRRLKTDRFDLYQMHCLAAMEDVTRAFGPDGALEAFVAAREAGLVRFLGFSAHTEEAALAAMDRFAFDTILFPFNRIAWHRGNFGPRVLEAARAKGLGILALKALGKRALGEDESRPWAKAWYAPVESYEEARAGLAFTLGLPGVTAAVSPGHAQLFDWMCRAAAEPADAPGAGTAVPDVAPIFSAAG